MNSRSFCSGLLTLNSADGWSQRHSLLLGSAEVRGASPFAAIDFQQAGEVFAPVPLDTGGAHPQPGILHLRDLELFNLPRTLAGEGEGPPGGVGIQALAALLWICKPREAGADSTVYVLDTVTASVSCAEVSYLRVLFERLQQNVAETESDVVLDFMARSPSSAP